MNHMKYNEIRILQKAARKNGRKTSNFYATCNLYVQNFGIASD